MTVDAVVVGGGVIGCGVAFALAREGLSVVLVERDRIGAHASAAAAGMLTPIAESRAGDPLFEAGVESLALFPAFVEEARELSGIDPQLVRCGVLRVARSADVAETLRARALALAAFECEWLPAEQARKREPRLASDAVGALWSPREAHVEPLLLTRALGAAAARRGARFELGVPVAGLLREGDRVRGVRLRDRDIRAEHTILCAGAWTRFFEEAGMPLPVEPVRGQMLALESPQPPPAHVVFGDDVYLVARRDGSIVVGATVERAGFDVRTTAAGVAELLAGATALLPELGSATFLRAWAGLRPGTPDGLPLVGAVARAPGLVVAAGHYRRGILMAPVTALWVAELLLRGRMPDAAARFAPDRLAG